MVSPITAGSYEEALFVHYLIDTLQVDTLPWSFPWVVRFGQRGPWRHSEHAISSANISPNEILRVIHVYSKPNIFDLSCGYHCVPYAFFKAGVWSAFTSHKSSIGFYFRDCLIQTEVRVGIFERFCTKLHHSGICNKNF